MFATYLHIHTVHDHINRKQLIHLSLCRFDSGAHWKCLKWNDLVWREFGLVMWQAFIDVADAALLALKLLTLFLRHLLLCSSLSFTLVTIFVVYVPLLSMCPAIRLVCASSGSCLHRLHVHFASSCNMISPCLSLSFFMFAVSCSSLVLTCSWNIKCNYFHLINNIFRNFF